MSAIIVRLPDSIHKMAREVASEDHISLNQFIASAVAEKLSALTKKHILPVVLLVVLLTSFTPH